MYVEYFGATNATLVFDGLLAGSDDFGSVVTLGPGSSIYNVYVGGYAQNTAGNMDLVLMRFNSLANQDTNFGTGGLVTYGGMALGMTGTLHDQPLAMTVDQAERVVITGFSEATAADPDMLLMRLLP